MSRLSLAQLEAIHWIAELGSFHAAAGRLNVTQPTISFRVREAEAILGAKLFSRAGRKTHLTPDGVTLAQYARRALRIIHELEDRARTGDLLRGTLRLGAADTFAFQCLPSLLRELEARYPRLEVELIVDNSTVLNDLINRRALDVAFLVNPVPEVLTRIEPLGQLEVAWVSSPTVRPSGGLLTPAVAARLHVLTHPEPSTLDLLIRHWFGTAGVHPERLSTCNSLAALKHLAISGVGLSVLPVSIVRDELAQGRLVRHAQEPAFMPQVMCAAMPSMARGADLVLDLARSVLDQVGLLRPL
jgi:DNA-binding transcriptional LysR family regulator